MDTCLPFVKATEVEASRFSVEAMNALHVVAAASAGAANQ